VYVCAYILMMPVGGQEDSMKESNIQMNSKQKNVELRLHS
jgi:uncharacterized protein YrzB (UPF0473 family)